MNINTLARLALIGLVYIYVSKLIDTLFHGLFRPVAFAGIIVGLNILAGIAQFTFFFSPLQICCKKTRKKMAGSWYTGDYWVRRRPYTKVAALVKADLSKGTLLQVSE